MADLVTCDGCGTEVAPGLKSCPLCHRLVHSARLKELAAAADSAQGAGDVTACLVAWRDALELLPHGSKQYLAVSQKIADIGQGIELSALPKTRLAEGSEAADEGSKAPAGPRNLKSGLAGAGTILVVLLTKGKFLLLGLTKASTFVSMMATLGLFWAEFGWPLALGLVVSIYIHEMGHVFELNRFGFRANAPLFIPGLGAMIRLRQVVTDPRQDARIGLAGPVWGAGAALAFAGAGYAMKQPLFLAIAQLGALLNLFNLLPVWTLDGSRALRSFTRPQRWFAASVLAVAWTLTEHMLPMVLMAVTAFRAATEPGAARADRPALLTYAALVAVLSALSLLPVSV